MGLLDKFKGKAADLVGDHKDQAEAAIDKVGDAANKATGGKHEDMIDKGVDAAKDGLGKLDGN